MRAMPQYRAELAFASRQAPDLGGRHGGRDLAFAGGEWQPVLPTFGQSLVALLVVLARLVERIATGIGRAGWLAPVLVAVLAWVGLQG
ncbi:MAG TPA: hypothetical protein PKA13_16960 [Geminicoccaceae bacterium]|nr:hypothetical protein [Geminicoccus sp.]HMU51468.1 hypothetical protein [Geminicoccaceae bacterium]